jgi:hypothetical protein
VLREQKSYYGPAVRRGGEFAVIYRVAAMLLTLTEGGAECLSWASSRWTWRPRCVLTSSLLSARERLLVRQKVESTEKIAQ